MATTARPSRSQGTQRYCTTLQPAGRMTELFLKKHAEVNDAKIRKRTYKPEDELDRNLTIRDSLNRIVSLKLS